MVVAAVKPKQRIRGLPVALPKWWLDAAVKATAGIDLTKLAETLTEVAGRETAWSRETVGKFLHGKHPTYELMLAFCAHFEDELLQPVFIANSYEEAHQLLTTLRRVRGLSSTPEKEARRQVLDDALELLEHSAPDQTGHVESKNEGIGSRRRPRGMVGGRSSSS